ncbi:hypothetical protein O2K51_07475 [Apibacter raozihei]|uniref:hypothetical protein n=1 Tax=Apibacter raozihei TaxID=2500547 RepID=UPI000FE393B7|nr:hypothetical protein [Apibacter raozihei]
MKKRTLVWLPGILFSLSGLLLVSCNNENETQGFGEIRPASELLVSKLISPHGGMIYKDLADLEKSFQETMMSIYGSSEGYSLINISYYPVKQGYAASIEYKTPQGKKGNYILTNSLFKYEGGTLAIMDDNFQALGKEVKSAVSFILFGELNKDREPQNITGNWDEASEQMIFTNEVPNTNAKLRYNTK